MIQELLGDAGLLLGDRKISFNNGGVVFEGSPSSSPSPSLSPSPISSSTTTITTTTTSTTIGSASSENLRCPRCDSSNTKFCYYNNYNLTQPRHFCKTCRRYWTKGGALRNIPIGGGCRKNKSTTVSNSTAGKTTSAAKAKTTSSSEIIKSLGSGFSTHDQLPAASNTNTVLWGSPQNSQLLALLRATQNPNPNLMSNAIGTKDEGPMVCSHVNTEPTVATGALNARNLGLEPPGQLPIGLFGSLGWRNNQHHQLHEQHQPQQNSVLLGEIQNSGIQELYQRARSSSNNYYTNDHYSSQGFALTPNASSSVLEPVSGSGGELGYWNPPFSWSDLPTSNASFP